MAAPARTIPPAFEPFSPDADHDAGEPPAPAPPASSAAWEVEDFAIALPSRAPGRQRRHVDAEQGANHGTARMEMDGRSPVGRDGPHAHVATDVTMLRARIAAELSVGHRAELAAAERRGHEQGYREGLAQGTDAAHAELVPLARSLEGMLASLREREQRFLGHLQENTVALALAVARQIVDREVTADVGVVEDLVQRALGEFPLDQPVRIRLHPADLELMMQGGRPGVSGDSQDPRRELSWLPDPLIARGGAVLEGRERIVDGRVDTALERVFRRLCNLP